MTGHDHDHDHNRDGPIDKIKDGLGMDSHDEPGTHSHDDLDADRPSGWAGVDDALGDTTNRPTGPDYGAGDTTDRDLDESDVTPARTRDEGL